jgi:hypothetical protein
MSTLNDYIKTQPNRPMREWAEIFDISRPHLIALLDGTRAPSITVAQRIHEQTNGAVPVASWPNMAAVINAAKGTAA